VRPQRVGLPGLWHDGNELLRRGRGGSDPALWRSGYLQHRAGQPVHRSGQPVHPKVFAGVLKQHGMRVSMGDNVPGARTRSWSDCGDR
jgi:hypothetical protein